MRARDGGWGGWADEDRRERGGPGGIAGGPRPGRRQGGGAGVERRRGAPG